MPVKPIAAIKIDTIVPNVRSLNPILFNSLKNLNEFKCN